MADNGRARLEEIEWRFSRLDHRSSGREVRPTDHQPRPTSQRSDTYPFDDGRDAARPATSHYGLREIYADPKEPWGGASAGLTSDLDRRYTELFDEPAPTFRPESAHVGTWSSIWDSDPVPVASGPPGVGDDTEVAWYSAALAGAVAAVGMGWGVVKKYPITFCLWAAVLVMWALPG